MKRRRKRRKVPGVVWIAIIVVLILFSRTLTVKKWVLQAKGTPKNLIELVERQPEAYRFAKHYKKNKGQNQKIDVSSEVKKGTIPSFIQWDERWGYHYYGSDYMAITGCAPTCLSMVYCGLKGDSEWHPLKMAAWAQRNHYYIKGVGTDWSFLSRGAKKLGLQVQQISPSTEKLKKELSDGKVAICSMKQGDFTSSGHFIVCSKMGWTGKITVCDPNSLKRSKKTWTANQLVSQMKQMWVYQ